jgi:hypothetical protein
MPNFILSDRRLRGCSTEARFLYALGWVFANHNRTDGEISPSDLLSLASSMDVSSAVVENAAAELVRTDLWSPSYRISGFLDWCDSAASIERWAAEGRERARLHRTEQREKEAKRETETEVTRSQQTSTGTYGVRTAYAANAAQDDETNDDAVAQRRRAEDAAEAEAIARQTARRGGDAEAIADILARHPAVKRDKRVQDQELPL